MKHSVSFSSPLPPTDGNTLGGFKRSSNNNNNRYNDSEEEEEEDVYEPRVGAVKTRGQSEGHRLVKIYHKWPRIC